MSPSVVDAPDLSGLIELSRDPHLDLKPVILRVQTDLFLTAPVRDRAALEAFASLAGGLIPTVDDETAEIVARKLSPFAETPELILVRLAARGGAIRDIVLTHAPGLTGPVIEAALIDGSEIGPAIAARPDLSGAVVAELSARGLADIDRALADNRSISLRGEALARLVARGRRSADLARALLARTDLFPGDLGALFLHADDWQRSAIRDAVAVTAALRPAPPAQREIGAILTGFSGRGGVAGLIAALGDALGLPTGYLGAVPDPSLRYDLLTLSLRAAGLREEDAVFIFLTLNATVARSVERVFALTALFRATTRPVARDLLSAILDTALPEHLIAGDAHQPYTAPDATKPRVAATERATARATLPGRVRRTY